MKHYTERMSNREYALWFWQKHNKPGRPHVCDFCGWFGSEAALDAHLQAWHDKVPKHG